MRRKRIKGLLSAIMVMCMGVAIVSCGTTEEVAEEAVEETVEPSKYDYLKGLENRGVYILHEDNSVEPLYFPNATFSYGSSDGPSSGRMIWFGEDYDKIPTFYQGDELIFYTYEVMDEVFTFERFEDLGYSIGLRELQPTRSGRYCISTVADDYTTYPNADTSQLLNFENESVIIEKLGDITLRALKSDDGSEYIRESDIISRCGTIKGLEKGEIYAADVYAGTDLYRYNFCADKRIMASLETASTINYEFMNETVARIQIPEFFNSGYYMANGCGLFRYVKGDSYDEETTDFNIYNIPTNEEGVTCSMLYDVTSSENLSEDDLMVFSMGSSNTKTFQIEEEGTYTVTATVEFTVESDYGYDGLEETSGYVVNPGQTKKWKFEKNGDTLSVSFKTNELGTYIVRFENLEYREADVNVTKVD